jgi:hypothetical protein
MTLKKYSIIWPKVIEFFPAHFQQDRLPTELEVQTKVEELYRSGNSMDASRLTLWWGSIPESAIPVEPLIQMHPNPLNAELSNHERLAFSRLDEIPQASDVPQDSKASGIRFRDFAIPLGVIILVIALMLSSVFVNGLTRVTPNGDGADRLDRFPREPVVIAPEAQYPGQQTVSTEEAPTVASPFFKTIHLYRVSDQLELSPNPTAEVAELWERAVAVFGADAKELDSFGVAYENSSEIAGYLDLDTRNLVINLNDVMTEPEVQNFTLIHEYNHMVTLMNQYESGVSCSTTLLLNGNACLDENSSLQTWIDQFWNEPGMLKNTSTGNIEAGEEMYSERPNEFFSVYAASAPQEDMAESFAAWVLGYPLPESKEKFFNEDGESRALKVRILSSLDAI